MNRSILAAAVIFAMAAAAVGHAATLQATPATFQTTFATAKAGDVLQLAPGTYTGLDYTFYNKSFSPLVTITSVDPAHPAVLTTFAGDHAKGLNFTNLELVAPAPGYFRFNFYNCADIHFDHVSVHGSMDGNPGNDAEGIAFTTCDNVSVTNSEFQQLLRGLSAGFVTNLVVRGNDFHDLEVTGMAIGGGSSNISITLNRIHDLYPVAGDHPDAIQFLTAGQTGTTHDVNVSDNFIYRGKGFGTQGIFFRDQTTKQHYSNITIARNLIVGTGYGGIAVDYTDGIKVDGNVLVTFAPPALDTPLQVFNSTSVSLTNNQANIWGTDGDTALVQSGNVTTPPVADGGIAAMTSWAASHPNMAALIAPYIPVVVDPRDAQIADLTARLATAQAAQAAAVAQVADLSAQLATAKAQASSVQSALAAAQATIAAQAGKIADAQAALAR